MNGDSIGTGMGTGAVYGKLLADLLEVAAHALAQSALTVHDYVSRRMVAHQGSSDPSARLPVVLSDALGEAADSGRLKPSTIDKYSNTILSFLTWLGCRDLSEVTPSAVREFLSERAAHGVGRGARRVDLSALRTVLDKLLGYDATRSMHYPAPSDPVGAATQEQVSTLLAAASDDAERLLVLMLNAMKLRPGQLVRLRCVDVLLDQRRLAVWRDKAKKYDLVPVPDEIVELLRRLLQGTDGKCFLFSRACQPQMPISVRAVQKRLARLCVRCGLTLTCTELRKAESLLVTAPRDGCASQLPSAPGIGGPDPAWDHQLVSIAVSRVSEVPGPPCGNVAV